MSDFWNFSATGRFRSYRRYGLNCLFFCKMPVFGMLFSNIRIFKSNISQTFSCNKNSFFFFFRYCLWTLDVSQCIILETSFSRFWKKKLWMIWKKNYCLVISIDLIQTPVQTEILMAVNRNRMCLWCIISRFLVKIMIAILKWFQTNFNAKSLLFMRLPIE